MSTFSSKQLSKILDIKEQPSVIDLKDLLAVDDLIDFGEEDELEKPEVKKEPNAVVGFIMIFLA